jgi:nicotinamidase-related amidase
MPPKNHDLHGSAPDTAAVALLLIDFINDFEFEDGKALFQHALPAAERTAALKHRVRDAALPVIYVNDNFGKWQSNFSKLITHCLADNVRGRPIVELLQPAEDDYFVLKPKQSGFYASTLDLLLGYLQVETVIITGVAGNICVLFTAHDAYMRDFHLIIPSDCIASRTVHENTSALKHMKNVLKADIRPSAELDMRAFKRKADLHSLGEGAHTVTYYGSQRRASHDPQDASEVRPQ